MIAIRFETDSAAFTDSFTAREKECARRLLKLAEVVEMGATSGRIVDVNGNIVGEWALKPEIVSDGPTQA